MMSRNPYQFRLFRWIIGKQLLLTGLILTVLYGMLLVWMIRHDSLPADTVALGRHVLLWTLIIVFIVIGLVSLITVKNLVLPLKRLIEKTDKLRKFPLQNDEVPEAELAVDEPGEWFEMERALDKLGRDLRRKTIRLSREKTELRAIMSAMSEAVLAVTAGRHPLFYNSQFAVLFDLEIAGSSEFSVSEIVRFPEVLGAYDRSLKEKETVRVEADLNLRNDPLPRTFQISVSPLLKRHNQEVYGAVGIFHDITELKRSEKIRMEFVGNVSHELRTPLTSIKGYLEIVLDDFAAGRGEDIKPFLEIVQGNVSRLMDLVNDLLDLSSIESGAQMQWKKISTRRLTANVLNVISIRDHNFRQQFESGEIFGDPLRVEQVLRNLVENAVRYVPTGGNIEIRWECGENGEVLMRVRDDGPGIPYEHQPRLFERFYRVDEGRSRDRGGTGIGLAIVKHIMQRHGGDVRVFSEPGRGAEFVCSFPVGQNGPAPNVPFQANSH